jgi:5-formyltetrahydrofolate cyclo-ligase
MARAHHADAGGPAEVNEAKQAIREKVWAALTEHGHARFPGARNRIPNTKGAEAAAERLRGTEAWRAARTIKSNPDAAQWPVRQRALEDGKTVYMAVPRLAEPNPFFLLDPERITESPRKASSIKGATAAGITVGVDDLEPVDLVVTGCVAVDPYGARLGKGGGFSDLEYAVAAEAGLIGVDTPVVTTVHPEQIVAPGEIPVVDHDFRLDLLVTADEVVVCEHGRAREPGRVRWEDLTEEKIAAIPLLGRLRPTGRDT